MNDEVVAYATCDGVVHAVIWLDSPGASELYLRCSKRIAPPNTRTADNPEPLTCLGCLSLAEAG